MGDFYVLIEFKIKGMKNKRLLFQLVCLIVSLFPFKEIFSQSLTEPPQKKIVSVRLLKNTIRSVGDFKAGDNWCQTWAADDNVYTMLDDGFGFNNGSTKYNNVPVRIAGNPNSFLATELTEGYPKYEYKGGWYAYGIISVDSILYTSVSITQTGGFNYFRGNKLFYSEDFGKSWFNHNGNPAKKEQWDIQEEKVFFWHEDPVIRDSVEGYAFSWISFCQNGQDNAHADKIGDPYIYLYSPEPAESWKLNLARVKKDSIRFKKSYEYFAGFDEDHHPAWTSQIKNRGVIYEFPNDNDWGWYSWQPSVVWNENLGYYIMVNYGSRFGRTRGSLPGNYWNDYMHDETCSIGFWYAEHPWGPWNQIFYEPFFYPISNKDRAYQLKLSPKWIEDDGKTMYLIWSDAKDSWTTHYLWNHMKITFQVE